MPTMAGMPKRGSTKAQPTPTKMEPKLKKLEARAGMKNFPLVFRMPMATAARDTRSRKGNMILVMVAVRESFPDTCPKSGAMRPTSSGEKKTPRRVIPPTRRVRQTMTLLANRQVCSAPRRWS